MEIKTQSENPDLAMIMVIDKSGSMDVGSQGLTCMDLAKEAAFRGVQELNEDDMVGIVSFDSQAQWVVELEKVGGNEESIKESIGTIQAGAEQVSCLLLDWHVQNFLRLMQNLSILFCLLTDRQKQRDIPDY